MDIIKLIKKLIKFFFIAWLIFVVIGIIVMGLNKKGVFKSIKDNSTTKEYSEEVKPFNIKSGATNLEVTSNGLYNAALYEVPTDIKIWDINNSEILYSTSTNKEELAGFAFDLNIYNMETGEINIIKKMDSAKRIEEANFNDKYIIWKEDNKPQVMDRASKEIVYQGESTFGEALYDDKLYLFNKGKIKEYNLKDKTENTINLEIQDTITRDILVNSKCIAVIAEDKIVVYNIEDKSKAIKEFQGDERFYTIKMNEERVIFTGTDLKESLEYNLDQKGFKSYEIINDFKEERIDSGDKRNGIYAAAKTDDKNNLKVVDILNNEKLEVNINDIGDKGIIIESYNNYLLLKSIEGNNKDIFRYAIKINK